MQNIGISNEKIKTSVSAKKTLSVKVQKWLIGSKNDSSSIGILG